MPRKKRVKRRIFRKPRLQKDTNQEKKEPIVVLKEETLMTSGE